MPSHGTASFDSKQLNQFSNVSGPINVALAAAVDGLDPAAVIRRASEGQLLRNHLRSFFAEDASQILRPRSIISLPKVPVNYDRKDWNDSINAAGPSTGAGWEVRQVGGLYVAERNSGIVPASMTLVNFGEDVSSDQVIAFGQEWNLGRVINPWECFAIGEHLPTLHTSPGFFAPMAVVSLKDCLFQGYRHVCGVWFDGRKRECNLDWFDFDWGPFDWFGFVSES